jgi:hypothetical protein
MRQHFLYGVSCLLLAACASGGGSGTGGHNPGGGPPAPQPNIVYTVAPAAPATTGANTTPAIAATAGGPHLAAAAPGTAFRLRQSALGFVPLVGYAADRAANDAGATLTIVNAATGQVRLRIPSLDVDADFAVSSGVSVPPDGRMHFLVHQSLQYVGLGNWGAESQTAGRGTQAQYIMGYETPAASMPAGGLATYSGTTSGWVRLQNGGGGILKGNAALTVNFSTASVSGALTGIVVNPEVANEPWNDVSLQASIVSGSAISGTATVTTAPGAHRSLNAGATGSLEGAFYGPAANELGAVWTLHDGTNGASGVIGAARQ